MKVRFIISEEHADPILFGNGCQMINEILEKKIYEIDCLPVIGDFINITSSVYEIDKEFNKDWDIDVDWTIVIARELDPVTNIWDIYIGGKGFMFD